MRTISTDSITKLTNQYGSDPFNIIEIQWVFGGPISTYATRDFGIIPGKIVSIGQIDDVMQIDNGADAKQTSIVLNDTDGTLKSIFDSTDIHKRDCYIYQAFGGLPTSDKFLIFKGQISSPITWDEGDRTLSFTVLTKVEDAEVGFSIEEGQFPAMPIDLIGKPWPLVFGSCINVPALRITTPREGTLAKSFGIHDFTLESLIKTANNIYCLPTYFGGLGVNQDENGNPLPVSKFGEDGGCAQRKCQILENYKLQLKQQLVYEYDSLIILGGEKFQQGQLISISVDGAHLTGQLDGNRFTVISRTHADIVNLGVSTADQAIAKMKQINDAGTVKTKCAATNFKTVNDKSADSFQKVTDHPTSQFQWVQAGSTVTFAFDEETIYIANLIPTSILKVAAYRTVGSSRRLLTVPPEYYTIRLVDYISYTATEIVFPKLLSVIADGWEDDIYVNQTSSVGPNTVDIMRWLITTYTSYEIDETSFTALRTILDTYPMHFPMLERKNILTMLQEMAFQARCTIYLKEDKFYLRYLSQEPDFDSEITEDDPDHKTLQVVTTPTEEIVTKLTATWQDDYSKPDPHQLILRQNVKKYGTQAQTYDFYCYNMLSLVNKSATFWLIRKSNTWRKVNFKTPIHKLELESLDTVRLTLPDLSDQPVTGIVEQANYDSTSNMIDFQVWTPVLSGTRVAYNFAFPGSADESLEWPPQSDIDEGLIGSGDAPGFKVVAPVGHQLSGTTTVTNTDGQELTYQVDQGCTHPHQPGSIGYSYCCESSFGLSKTKPSICGNNEPEKTADSNDKKPDPLAEPDTSGEINTGKDPKFNDGATTLLKQLQKDVAKAQETAQKASDVANSANEAAGGSGSASDPLNNPENPYLSQPCDFTNDPIDENDTRPTCSTTIIITWFPITASGTSCVPVGGASTVTEIFTYGGSGKCDSQKDPGDGDGGYTNSPCKHVFKQCISNVPPGGCAPGKNDGKLLCYNATQSTGGGPTTPYTGKSVYQPGSGGVVPGPGA